MKAWLCRMALGWMILMGSFAYGQSWEWQNPHPTGDWLETVTFLDPSHGWMVGCGAGGLDRCLLYTSDGGASWSPQLSGMGNPLRDLCFVSPQQGWAVGQFGWVMHYRSGSASATPAARNVFPQSFSLAAYPNPFNPTTTLAFDLAQSGRTKLVVYDVMGRVVSVVADNVFPQGEHRPGFDGSALASGTYFVRLESGKTSRTQRLLLLR